jgi:hypothetical protein
MTVGSRRRSTGPDKLTVEAAVARSKGRCEYGWEELSGRRGVGWAAHHRRARRMGGSKLPDTNGIENILVLCTAHHEHIERHRAFAYEWGFLVRQSAIPAAVPVWVVPDPRAPGFFALLTDDAQYRPVETVEVMP